MGGIEVNVSSHIRCSQGRRNWPGGVVLWAVFAPTDFGKKYLEIIVSICQGNCSNFMLHQYIMS